MIKKFFLTIVILFSISSVAYPATRTISDTGGNWNDTAAWAGGVVPITGDDVVATATSGNLTLNVNSVYWLKSFDLTGYTGTFTMNATLYVGLDSSGTTICKFAGTIAGNSSAKLYLRAYPSGSTVNFTSGGVLSTVPVEVSMRGYIGSYGGTINQMDNLDISAGTILHDGGTWNTNGYSITAKSLKTSSQSSSYYTFNFTNSTLTFIGTGEVWRARYNNNLILAGSTIIINNTTTTAKYFIGGGLTYNIVTFIGDKIYFYPSSYSGDETHGDNNNIITTLNLNMAGYPNGVYFPVPSYGYPRTQTITNFNTNGSAGNMVRIQSFISGTAFTIAKAGGGTVNVDYCRIKDSTATPSSTWYAGAGSRNAGGNTGWTFAYNPTTKTITDGGGNWGDDFTWVEGILPIAGDAVVATITSGNLVVNTTSAELRSFDLTGYLGEISGGGNIFIRPASGTVNCKFAGTVTFTGSIYLRPQGSSIINVTTAGAIIGTAYLDSGTGTVNQLDDLYMPTGSMYIYSGTWNTNGHDITVKSVITDYGSALTKVINLGASTITFLGLDRVQATTIWNFTSGGATINAGTSEIIINNDLAQPRTFAGGNFTYGTLTVVGDNLTITGSNTFNTINVNNAGLTNGLKFTAGTTQTVTNFTTNGYADNLAKILSTTGASPFYLNKSGGGNISVDYMSIQDSYASPSNKWYAGENSLNVSGNNGWIFEAPSEGYTTQVL